MDKITLPPLDFMQPDLLDVERGEWPTLTFTVDKQVGPSGFTTVIVAGPTDDVRRYLTDYFDDDGELATFVMNEGVQS